VRLRGIDAPELHGRCASETAAAAKARDRLAALVGAAKRVEIHDCSGDKYGGRWDCHVAADGRDLGAQLVAEGLARRYSGGTRQGWCE
jgi:endonuclease YncB( thermonuclease family)